ncbi:MAG: DMT family transporter [Alphaproteobacteria bacterium]|nr:DMT family transporter [Alphaproteobacteria bacterium]MCB9928482.1 DMT family transporter [Alphaproteobacteria bacterium]
MQQDIPRGILCIALSTVVLTSQDAITKWLLQSHHAGEVMFIRGLMAVPVVVVMHLLLGHSLPRLRSRKPGFTAYRSVIAVVCSFFVTLSFVFLPLADALAIVFVSPLIITALSAVMLREPVGWRRWLAVMAGFGGVLLITEPGQAPLTWVIVLPLMAALTAAFRDIASRQLAGVDPPTTTLFWNMIANAIGGALTLPFFGFTWPAPDHWLLFGLSAVMVVIAMWLIVAAFQLASGAAIAPYRYLSLVWAGLIGYAVWGDIPSETKLLGAAIVAVSGLFILWRETRLRRQLKRA